MSNNVDRRLVEMKFDNKDFENNIHDSVESLDKLKKSLNLEESAKGLTALEKAGRKFSLDGIAEAAEAVTRKFSVLGTIGDQVLRRIGDAAFNALNKMKNFVDALTIQPISTGMMEYETQINAIQTILANTQDKLKKQGYSDAERLALVNDRLDQLNRYADKTIYNFTEMTRNIGTFTAAGVDLDVAVESIQGIANLAAVSGSTSEQASRAMYQLSQAISSGTVKLMDWNSVVNAGMGGEVFQKALLRTAKAMGNVSALGEEAQEALNAVEAGTTSFRDSLSSGWLTKDILTATLEQFSWDFKTLADAEGKTVEEIKEAKRTFLLSKGYTKDEADAIIDLAESATEAATKVKTFTQLLDTLKEAAQSGWTQTWEYIIGDFEEAKETLTGISDYFGEIIGNSADARNAIVKEWHDAGGRDMIWNKDPKKGPLGAFWNLVYGIKNIIDMIRGEFQKIFPPATGQMFIDITQRIQQITASFKAWTENSEGIDLVRRIISGMANGLDIVRQVIGGIWDVAKQIFGFLFPYSSGLMELIANGADKISEFNQHLKETGGVQKVVERVSNSIKNMIDIIKQFGLIIKDLFSNGPEGILGRLKDWFGNFSVIGDKIKSFFDDNTIFSGIKSFFSNIADSITTFAKNLDGGDIASVIGTVLGAGLVVKITSLINGLGKIKNTLIKTIKKTGKDVGEAIDSFGKGNKGSIVDSILKIAASLVLVAGALYIVAKIDPNRLGDALLAMGAMLAAITAFAFILSKIKFKNAAGLAMTSAGLLILGGAMLVFAGAISRIGQLDTETIVKGIAGLGAILLELAVFLALTKKAKMGIFKGAGLILLAVSLTIFAKAVEKIGGMDTGTIVKGIAGLGAILLELAVFLALTKKAKIGVFKGAGLILMAVSLNMFANTIQKIGNFDTGTIVKGIAGLGAILLELAVFLALTKKAKMGIFKGAGLILLAVSLNMFVNTIQKIGNIDTGTIVKGIAGLGAILLELAVFLALTKKAKIGVFKGAGLILMAVSLNMFANTIQKIGSFDTGTIVKGITGLGAILLELAVFLALTKKAKIGVFKGAGLILMAVSLNMFANAISKIGNLKTKVIIKGVAGIGLVLLEFMAFAKLFKKIKFTDILKSVAIFGIMAVAMQTFALVLKSLNGIESSQMLAFSTSFGVALLSLSASILLISKVPVVAAIAGIAKLALVAAEIIALMAVFGAAEQALNVSSYINRFGDLAESIGRAIGRFVGGIGSGIMQGLDLPKIGEDLSSFMKNIQPFLDGCKGVDESVKTGVGNLAAVIVAIGGAEIVSAVSSWFVGDNPISQFADDIGTIATALNNFASSVSGFSETDNTSITNAVAAAEGLAILVKAVPWDAPEWATAIVGSRNVEGFADDAATLATALLNYATNISGFSATVTQTDITNSTNAVKGLVELQNALPATGGWLQKLTGIKSLSNFAVEIPGFALGMKMYAAGISGFTDIVSETDITNSTNAAKGLIELQKALPAEGGWLQKLLGVKSLSDFAVEIPGFALGMKMYAAGISGFTDAVSETDITNSTNAAKALAGLAETIPAEGGWVQKILGQQDLGSFGEKCAQLGAGLGSFATDIGGVSAVQTANAIQVVTDMQTFADTLEKDGGVFSRIGAFFSGEKSIVTVSEQMESFGSNFKSFTEGITGAAQAAADFDIVATIIASFVTISEGIRDSGVLVYDLERAGNVLGETFGTTMVGAIMGLSSDVQSAVDDVVANASTDSEDKAYYQSFYDLGVNLGQGIANGISSMAGSVSQAAVSAASGAIRSIQITWSVHSPSRVGEDLGMYFDLGIASGLESYSKVVSGKAADMGREVVESASTMLRGVDGSIFDNIDPNPTIRPVMDLTNIQNGVGVINDMFNSDRMIGQGLFRGMNFSRGVDALNLDGARILGSINNKDVVSELQSLSNRFDNLAEAVSNMQLVLDSGELVGRTSAMMDSSLGTLDMRRRRGN